MTLFVLAWGALMFGGLRTIRGPPADHQNLVIMALASCGIALLSWQWSTTYSYPMIRLQMALSVAILWKYAVPQLKHYTQCSVPRMTPVATAIICCITLMLTGYYASLHLVQRIKRTPDRQQQLVLARWAYRLAPGAFDPLYMYAVKALRLQRAETLSAIASLHRQYPYVPVVLFKTAMTRLQMGDVQEAQKLLRHALANDPGYVLAQRWLTRIEQMPLDQRQK
jgi:hypothetical protein